MAALRKLHAAIIQAGDRPKRFVPYPVWASMFGDASP
jgi:hypothetical protein